MRYVGTKFTASEAEQIRREARIRLGLVKSRPRDEVRRRDNAGVVHKTIVNARVAAASAADEQTTTSWAEWVVEQIEARAQVQCEAIGEIVAGLEHELERVRHELKLLREEVAVEVKLDHRIAALNAEVAKARSQAPDFKSDLSDLQEDVEKLQKSAGWLRAANSTLEFNQKQLEAEQRQSKQTVSMTAVKLTSVGSQTREVLERLRASGFDLSAEVLS